MKWVFAIVLVGLLCVVGTGCSDKKGDEVFGFGVSNTSGAAIVKVTVAFAGHGSTWPIGNAGEIVTVGPLDGPVPDAAEVTWTDGTGVVHKQRVQITPLPPSTKTSYVLKMRRIWFIFEADESVKVLYHDPRFKE